MRAVSPEARRDGEGVTDNHSCRGGQIGRPGSFGDKRARKGAPLVNARPLTFHSLRHTFATLSLEGGKSIK